MNRNYLYGNSNRQVLCTLLCWCIICIALFRSTSLQAMTFAPQSVLSSGKWVKVSIVESGMYQLNDDDLKRWGFNNPANIKIYGYGGAILPENFLQTFIDDLPQIPVYRNNKRGVTLFYAQGVTKWKYDTNSMEYVHTNNHYSTKGYYFITENSLPPIQTSVVAQGTMETTNIDKFDDYTIHQSELVNIAKSGRELYGEDFRYNTEQEFPFIIPGISGKSNVRVEFIAKTGSPASIKTIINDKLVIDAYVAAQSTSDEYELAKKWTGFAHWTTNGMESVKVKILYGGINSPLARLNFIRLNTRRQLKIYDSFTQFRDTTAIKHYVKYNIGLNGSDIRNIMVWDVTTPSAPKNIVFTDNGSTLSFKSESKGLKEYVAFDVSKPFATPVFESVVPNQNLHALPQTEMIIIVHPALRSEAERLAAFHRNQDKLHVTIAEPEEIYNEFSSGTPDATAYRRFVKMFFDRAKGVAENKPRYLLLFGDGGYDNRLITNVWEGTNACMLLTYQNDKSLSTTQSSVIDDYFGFVADNSGQNLAGDKVEVGIGRFPVRSLAEARTAVDKAIYYAENKEFGIWKNALCLIADDGDKTSPNLHIKQADSLAKVLEVKYPEFLVNKVYVDSYKKIILPYGESSPDAKKKIFDLLNDGLLMINYTGHGTALTWSSEDLMNISDINKLKSKQLPLFVTATCDYSRFDDVVTSAGEKLFLQPGGGAIALFTTTRVVYAEQNEKLNQELLRHIFTNNENGERMRLGDIMRATKRGREGIDSNKLNFTLLGDPALKLLYPEYDIKITEVNGQPADGQIQTLKAGGKLSLKGEVLLSDGKRNSNFNGEVSVKVYDSKIKITTLDNDKIGKTFDYSDRSRLLYSGKGPVNNGTFSIEFRVSREISYSDKNGLINLYAYSTTGEEAHAHFDKFLVGGAETGTTDTEGPLVTAIYLNNTNFQNGDKVNETPLFTAEVEDMSGINVSGSGQNITLTLDNSTTPYILNNNFETINGSSVKGKISFSLPAISAGKHTLSFKVYDTENNSTVKTLSFETIKGYKQQTFYLQTDQNPAKESTRFYFSCLQTGGMTSANIQVSDISGNIVWSHRLPTLPQSSAPTVIDWNLTGSNGKKIVPGVYYYQAVMTNGTIIESTDLKKITILVQ